MRFLWGQKIHFHPEPAQPCQSWMGREGGSVGVGGGGCGCPTVFWNRPREQMRAMRIVSPLWALGADPLPGVEDGLCARLCAGHCMGSSESSMKLRGKSSYCSAFADEEIEVQRCRVPKPRVIQQSPCVTMGLICTAPGLSWPVGVGEAPCLSVSGTLYCSIGEAVLIMVQSAEVPGLWHPA